jgi:hypothetical protein
MPLHIFANFLKYIFKCVPKIYGYQFIIPKKKFHFMICFQNDTITPPYSQPSGPRVSMKNWNL